MDTERVTDIARGIVDANQRREKFQPLRGDNLPDTLESAYQVQDMVYDLLGSEGGLGPLGGHKIALTSKALQQLCGIEQPVYGAIFKNKIMASQLTLSLSDYVRLGLEFEVGVQIAENVPVSDKPWTRDSIAPFVGEVMPAFELIEDRNADYSELDAISVLADRCWCAGAILGQPVTGWRATDLAHCAVQLRWNGETVDQGVTGDSMGHPFNGLAWVANHLASRERQLRAGDTVITGSALKTRFPVAGDTVCYQIDGLGEVTVNLTA